MKFVHVVYLANLVLFAGCRFGVDGLPIGDDAAVTDDGGPPDANVEMGERDFSAVTVDLARTFDLARHVPDGATPGKTGWPCSLGNECDNGLCIDGYCCEDLCDPFDPSNRCRACNVPGNEGRCVFALDDTDPRGLCAEEPASSCGRDGRCDGKGSCRRWPAGTVCGATSCTGGSVTAPPLCDGQGTCVPSTGSASCAPYTCGANSCHTSCTPGGSECVGGAACDINGRCNMKRALGQSCDDPNQCATGFCSSGVCCSSDCAGPCRSCALTGALGLCLFIPAGSDPFSSCTASTRESCGLDGNCDGAGNCRMWAAGTPCAPASCSGTSTVAARACNGSGTCLPGTTANCDPYSCNPATVQCFSSCSNNTSCAPGSVCKPNMKCLPP